MTFPQLTGPLPARTALVISAVLLGLASVHAWNVLSSNAPSATMAAGSLPPGPAIADPAALHLFGTSDAAPAQEAVAAPPPNLALTGVIAASGTRPAVALITVDGKQQAFRPGDAVASGWSLREIQRDHVVIEQGGVKSELALPNTRTALAIMPVTAVTVPPGLRGNGPMMAPSQFKLEVQNLGPNHLGFSKAELSHGLQDPHVAGALGRATPSNGGGLQLDDVPAGSLPERIGLKSGDVLRTANGQALNSLTDLPRLYQEFGSAGEVRLEITRGGQPTILQYSMRP